MPLPFSLSRFLGVPDRCWTLPTPLEAARAQARLDERALSIGWSPLSRGQDRSGRRYYLAATADPISAFAPFGERFELIPVDQLVTVTGRAHPGLRWVIGAGGLVLGLGAVAGLVAAIQQASVDLLFGSAACLLGLVFLRFGLPRLSRNPDHRRMRRWLESILGDDDPTGDPT
jgi:hypothetical protein